MEVFNRTTQTNIGKFTTLHLEMAFGLSCAGCFYGAGRRSNFRFSSFRCTWVRGKWRLACLQKQYRVKSSFYGLLSLAKTPSRTLQYSVVCRIENDEEEHNSNESSRFEPNKDEENANKYEKSSREDQAALEEMDRLAEEWIGQDLSRWYTYRKFQALRNKLLKQEEEDELDTQREYEELYANLLIFGKMIGFPLVDEDTGKINLYGYMVMIFFLLLPLVVVCYLGQAISSGVDWIIEHQSPF
ncbi:hypothetical protein GpartN1_g4575.t1 [Galdieria partita]|uniref:Uncharacterized protein n=1 Tax=Galdieria partita TaxID=83374 RepID=A0A9C7PZ18_9RHOD|nr:hypothetical protein GpartN1_g4575.t1 [Galdieria partita]